MGGADSIALVLPQIVSLSFNTPTEHTHLISQRRRRHLAGTLVCSPPLHDHMRWTIAKRPPLLRRRRPLSSIAGDISLSEEILTILHTVPSIEPALNILAPLLSPHLVSAVLHSSPPLPLPPAFRFFVWCSLRPHLRSFPSHNRIISLLRSSTDASAAAFSVLDTLTSQSLPIPPPAFTAIISALSSRPEQAIAAFARMPDFACRPNTFTYNTLLHILFDNNVSSLLAMALYTLMLKSDCRPNRATYTILIHGLSKEGNTKDAFRLFDEMLRRDISPNTTLYTVFLTSHCRANKLGHAFRLLKSMKQPDSVAYNVMLAGFCRSGRVDEAVRHLDSFREEGFVLGLSGYSCLIDGMFRAGRFDDACAYYREMLAAGNVAPDCVLYTIMIRGYVEAGRIDDAVSFLSEMTGRGIVPDTFCYNTLVKGLCDAGLLDRARALKLDISRNDGFPDSATYTIMICGLCKEGLVHEAQQIFDEMGKLGCFPTVMTFNALIDGLCKAGRLEEAHILFYKMEMGKNPSLFLRLSQGANKVRDSNSLRKMVEELCQSGHVVKAYKLLRDIIESGVMPDVITYNILINGLCKAGNLDGALKLFKELQFKGHSPDVITYGTLIDGLHKVHREDDASAVYQSMERSGCAPSMSIYSTLMRTLCRKKRISKAVSLWLDHISQGKKLPKDAEAIRMVREHHEQGNLEEVVRGLVVMEREHGGSVGSFPYTIWLIGCCQAGRVDEALKIFSILTEFNIDATPPSCVLLINCLCRQRKVASALDVMLYALRKGFFFDKPVGNRLIRKLCMHAKKDALELAFRMRLAGYDMDTYLRASTKALLNNHQSGVS